MVEKKKGRERIKQIQRTEIEEYRRKGRDNNEDTK
jgi:hypothetical protein